MSQPAHSYQQNEPVALDFTTSVAATAMLEYEARCLSVQGSSRPPDQTLMPVFSLHQQLLEYHFCGFPQQPHCRPPKLIPHAASNLVAFLFAGYVLVHQEDVRILPWLCPCQSNPRVIKRAFINFPINALFLLHTSTRTKPSKNRDSKAPPTIYWRAAGCAPSPPWSRS